MILFFTGPRNSIYALGVEKELKSEDLEKLKWLFDNSTRIESPSLDGPYIGPRKEMITPWSTNAVEIAENMDIEGIQRIEHFVKADKDQSYDKMLQSSYPSLGQDLFSIDKKPDPIIEINNIGEFNQQEGLALSNEEIKYLEEIAENLGRKLTDSEVFGFSQVNSEHCRHKIFNGKFIIDGEAKDASLFQLIKETSKKNHNRLVSAYKDNVAFVKGPRSEQFAPPRQDVADYFETKEFNSVISLKAETHNFPTTVEPFNGAATGSGGEIRDRMAGGKASIPLAGTAVYMTSYPRLGRGWEKFLEDRGWLYQTPLDILIKASNGASDFGNKFGQPLICGSILTFEHLEHGRQLGYDKVIMMAGGIGFGRLDGSKKDKPRKGDKVVVLGGDNYRIGMGGGAVSSVATGEYDNRIELNAVQRSNPEMQKRVFNAIRAMSELKVNPIVAIHDHGAGGHLNCLSELLEESGGKIDVRKLPVGDPTLSAKEIIGNESQERIGLIIHKWDLEKIWDVAARERAPLYVVGEVTEDQRLHFYYGINGSPLDLKLEHMFGSSPTTIIEDKTINIPFAGLQYEMEKIPQYLEAVLKLESVACKDWLTNKVDRSVTGKVAKQQTTGAIQLPLNNVGVMAVDYLGEKGIATAIGHAPVSALIDPVAGSRLSIAESITNILWAPIEDGLEGISLSANWMWPAKNPGEDARLYKAVEACSEFAIQLGVNIPTGKDSLSMTQKYPNGSMVYSPGTVIISAVGEVPDINNVVEPALVNDLDSTLIYLDFSSDVYKLGGSSFAQIINKVGEEAPTVKNPGYFKQAFTAIQELIKKDLIMAGHDISAGGMVVTLSEMCFPTPEVGLEIDFKHIVDTDMVKILFSENPGVIIQVKDTNTVEGILKKYHLSFKILGFPTNDRQLSVGQFDNRFSFDIDKLRDSWFETSYLMDTHQCGPKHAKSRYKNYKDQPLEFNFPSNFTGKLNQYNIDQKRKNKTGIKAAIIREKGVNGDREMAYAMHLAGFDVKDVHMTDLIWGEENLEDINFLVFVGGFSNSDVLGSAKGWAGAFLYNELAKKVLDNFYSRDDTLSLGVCNGCQLMMELGLVYPEHKKQPKLLHNKSGKFESAFVNVTIPENNSVMLRSLAGTRLGVHLAHGEGRFKFPLKEEEYNVSGKFSYEAYPGNPNGSDYAISSVHSADGRHLVMMPHLERSIFPWNWAYYPEDRKDDEVSPWIEAFVNARKWVEERSS